MTILTSLLIATQGLLPSPTPLSIGTQGLLQVDSGPPPPPPVVARDLPGGFTSRPIRKVEIRGVTARLTADGVEVKISASVQAQGNRAAAQAGTPSQHISTALMAQGNTTNLSANRIKPSISTSFEIVGCEEDDEAAIRMLAQAALEEFYLQNIVDSYDD
jgi:hypothetical protein